MRTDLTDAMRTTLVALLRKEQGIYAPDLHHPTNQRFIQQGLRRRDLVTDDGRLTEEGRQIAHELAEEANP